MCVRKDHLALARIYYANAQRKDQREAKRWERQARAHLSLSFTPYFALGHSASYLAEERIIGVCRMEEEARKRLEIAKEKISDEIRARCLLIHNTFIVLTFSHYPLNPED